VLPAMIAIRSSSVPQYMHIISSRPLYPVNVWYLARAMHNAALALAVQRMPHVRRGRRVHENVSVQYIQSPLGHCVRASGTLIP
jgi:hypothetical protein